MPTTDEVLHTLVEDIIRGCRLGPPLTPEQQAERRDLQRKVDEFRRRYPALAAALDAELDGPREIAPIASRGMGTGIESS